MKAKIKESENIGFKPVTIEITIESKEELRDLRARVIASTLCFSEDATYYRDVSDITSDLDEILNNLCDLLE